MSARHRFSALAVSALFFASVAVGVDRAAAQSVRSGHALAPVRLSLVHPGVLSVGTDASYPPMESSNVHRPGTYVGADIDLAGALAKAAGIKSTRIVDTAFDSIIPALQRGNFDIIMSSMNDTPARRKQITFIDYMRLRAAESILVPKSSSLHAGGYAGLCGHSVSVESGTVELDGLNAANKSCSSKIDIHSYSQDTAAFQALASGHVDAYTTDLPVALYYAKNYKQAIRFAGKSFGSGAYYGIGILKRAKALKATLAHALNVIRHNGVYLKILRHYGLGATALPGSR